MQRLVPVMIGMRNQGRGIKTFSQILRGGGGFDKRRDMRGEEKEKERRKPEVVDLMESVIDMLYTR